MVSPRTPPAGWCTSSGVCDWNHGNEWAMQLFIIWVSHGGMVRFTPTGATLKPWGVHPWKLRWKLNIPSLEQEKHGHNPPILWVPAVYISKWASYVPSHFTLLFGILSGNSLTEVGSLTISPPLLLMSHYKPKSRTLLEVISIPYIYTRFFQATLPVVLSDFFRG